MFGPVGGGPAGEVVSCTGGSGGGLSTPSEVEPGPRSVTFGVVLAAAGVLLAGPAAGVGVTVSTVVVAADETGAAPTELDPVVTPAVEDAADVVTVAAAGC